MTQKITAGNSTFAIGGVSYSADSLVVGESLVFHIKICGEMPAHRKSANRYKPFIKTMNKFYFIIIASLLLTIRVHAQTGIYVCRNNDGYSTDLIKFFENGRFELVHDEQCYAYTTGAGIFNAIDDSIQLLFFKQMDSKKEVIEKKNTDKKVDVNILVLSLQDSSIVNTAIVFARDTTRQKYDLTETVDSNGKKTFSIPEGKTIKYIRVYADNYVDCEIVFDEKYNIDYSILIYLSEDPLQKKDYKGLTDNKGVAILKGKNKIVYIGRTFKKNK